MTYEGSALDLAAVCGKPFSITALSIREPGDSEILKVMEPAESEEVNEGDE
jgi:ribosomal protein L30E